MPNTVKNASKQKQTAIPEINPLFEGLNKEQLEAVRHTTGPLLIVAGAGTGKTTVITRRITYLVKEGLAKGEEIAALTFTEKAAGEMQERVDMLLPLGYFDSWICTFHSFCERILKAHGLDIGLPNDFELLSETDQWIFLYKNIEEFKLSYYKPLGNPSRFVSALLSHFSRCKDEMIQPEDYLKYAEKLRLNTDSPDRSAPIHRLSEKDKLEPQPINGHATQLEEIDGAEIERIEELANAYHTYQRLLLKHNYLDFGDLINYCLQLFKKRPKILEYYQKKFKFLMVDEFQDTNLAQYELVKLLSQGHKNLVVVGDDDQSIYKFRGASVSNILKFKEDYPGLSQITLVENYRSTQQILDCAYNFVQANNPDRLEVKLGISKKLKSNISDEGVIEVIEAEDLAGELDAVAKKAMALKQASGDSWNDFAILIRANSAANELLPILFSSGIPYTFFANRGLYKKPIILELLSYLRLLNNGHDSSNLYKVLMLPKFHVSHADVSAMLQHAHKKAVSLYETLHEIRSGMVGISEDGKKKAALLLDMLTKHSGLIKRCHAAEIFVHVVKDLGIEERVKEETLEAVENRELIEQFYKKIESFEQQNDDKSLHNFLYLLDLECEAGNEGEIKFDPNIGPESLKVMTIHSSKGLEFKYVFVINMVDQRFPTREKSDPIEIPSALVKDILPEGDFHLQEERRLFYVAITRAKSHLYLTWAKDYGGARSKKPSLFLLETKLVPSDTVSKATGKVVFTKQHRGDVVFTSLPTQFSYSQLSDFETCPLKYKYQHYLKLPVEGSCHLSFGQTIHKVFEEYLKLYKSNQELPQQDLFGKKPDVVLPAFGFLEELYQRHWVDDWYKNKKEKEEYRLRGSGMLKTFYEYMEQNPCRPKFIEQRFELKLGDYKFTGKIDRADWAEDGIIILDYKTGKTPKKGDKKKDLDQLYIYQWAAQEYLREKVYGLKYWFLQDNQFIEEPIAEQEKVDELKSRLFNLIEKIVHTTKYNLFKEEHKHVRDHDCEFEYLE